MDFGIHVVPAVPLDTPQLNGEWLTVVSTGVDSTGAPWAILNSNPSDFCAIPPGLVFGWWPWLAPPANQITSLGNGNWLFKYFQLDTEQRVEAAYVNMCGQPNHSNPVYFTVQTPKADAPADR